MTDSGLIIPGERIGAAVLGMDKRDACRVVGKPDRASGISNVIFSLSGFAAQ